MYTNNIRNDRVVQLLDQMSENAHTAKKTPPSVHTSHSTHYTVLFLQFDYIAIRVVACQWFCMLCCYRFRFQIWMLKYVRIECVSTQYSLVHWSVRFGLNSRPYKIKQDKSLFQIYLSVTVRVFPVLNLIWFV